MCSDLYILALVTDLFTKFCFLGHYSTSFCSYVVTREGMCRFYQVINLLKWYGAYVPFKLIACMVTEVSCAAVAKFIYTRDL